MANDNSDGQTEQANVNTATGMTCVGMVWNIPKDRYLDDDGWGHILSFQAQGGKVVWGDGDDVTDLVPDITDHDTVMDQDGKEMNDFLADLTVESQDDVHTMEPTPTPTVQATKVCDKCHGRGHYQAMSDVYDDCPACGGKGTITVTLTNLKVIGIQMDLPSAQDVIQAVESHPMATPQMIQATRDLMNPVPKVYHDDEPSAPDQKARRGSRLTIEGTATVVGQGKDYGQEYGSFDKAFKYFLKVVLDDGTMVKAMVLDHTQGKYFEHIKAPRPCHFRVQKGDRVRFTTFQIKNGWASMVGWKDTLTVLHDTGVWVDRKATVDDDDGNDDEFHNLHDQGAY